MTPRISTLFRATALAAALGLVMLLGAPAASAAPKLDMGPSTGMKDGQQVTVKASGFAPNLKNIAVGQCRAVQKGPSDCNLKGGATFRNADGSGAIAPVTITLSEKFGAIDCTKEACVVAAAPLPNTSPDDVVAANTVSVKITFGGGDKQASAEPAAAPAANPAPTVPEDDNAGALPKTGGTDNLPVLLMAAAALVMGGLGVLLVFPGRRRHGVSA
ncbi:LPXTG cell wall anchor domain-containing protein [Mumia sp. zg.B17]|uniref:neocarzinostatin apoprotein domain-containing protein n=1 Tax=unclassified Mumia TaxID=2621872 RepID=UPI001C6EA3BD|nr:MULTISPECIES: neocarzinostatin apoprotein domain-containing protein [unclassified Mumia]MBW9205557.1 LPXTG cell wall anchor domain-containing protein [Mumia sp. zg.B17]MBW9208442.1 LPXTG cell wall anchor domain-containing protein [Mumia sp. zg.B21]